MFSRVTKNANSLIRGSYLEMIQLCEFYRHFGVPMIIGGWAVYFYNSYFGSVDIDLISPSFRGSFSNIIERYQRAFGYEILNVDTMGLQIIARKPVTSDGRLVGYIEIDACSTDDPNAPKFHENTDKQLPYSLCFEDKYRKEVKLSDKAYCYIPCKSLLLLYKLKAIRDRTYDLKTKGATLPEDRVIWLRDKIVKDKADVVALLDPNPKDFKIRDQVDPTRIVEITQTTGTGFLLGSLEEVPRGDEAIRLYDPMLKKQEVERWCKRLIDTPMRQSTRFPS